MPEHTSRSHKRAVPDTFRPMAAEERELPTALPREEFPGQSALLRQARQATARSIDDDGSLEFDVADASAASVGRRIPVEAELDDVDGVVIHVLLHVLDGFLSELEVYREDSKPVQRMLDPEALRLLNL